MTALFKSHFSSLEASGNSLFFFKSVLEIRATNSFFSFTIGNFPEKKIKLRN